MHLDSHADLGPVEAPWNDGNFLSHLLADGVVGSVMWCLPDALVDDPRSVRDPRWLNRLAPTSQDSPWTPAGSDGTGPALYTNKVNDHQVFLAVGLESQMLPWLRGRSVDWLDIDYDYLMDVGDAAKWISSRGASLAALSGQAREVSVALSIGFGSTFTIDLGRICDFLRTLGGGDGQLCPHLREWAAQVRDPVVQLRQVYFRSGADAYLAALAGPEGCTSVDLARLAVAAATETGNAEAATGWLLKCYELTGDIAHLKNVGAVAWSQTGG